MNNGNDSMLSQAASQEKKEIERQRIRLLEKEAECMEIIEGESRSWTGHDGHCNATWDNVMCWPRAKAGELVSLPCPDYVHLFQQHKDATRYCSEDGTWFVHPSTNKSWTNFSLCHPIIPEEHPDHSLYREWLPTIKVVSQVGYALSLCTLIIAFCILISIKKLRCPRNTLHMHLFVSFIFRAFMALLKDTLFIDGLGLPQSIADGVFMHEQANWECKLVTSLWQYFIVANYSWILMEGLYLHNLIFLAPFSDSSAITLYVFLGWGLPIPVVTSWALCRVYLDDTLCWTTHTNATKLFLIIRIPIIASILLNFLFFVNITRVLLVKLQSAVSIETRKYRYRKWAKSTLVLVPLFGVHYMLFIGMSYFMGINIVVEVIWLFCDQLFASFQGFCVAILYCLWNGEVRGEIAKKWHGWRNRDDSESKNVWVPLQGNNSRLNHHRSTHEEVMSATSIADGAAHSTKHSSYRLGGKGSKFNGESINTEEHQMEIT